MAKSKKSPHLSHVRIIGGEYRRRLVAFIEADGLRPTPDRLRETLFNWLNNDLPNASVLDCCAGSGVLGFEALSRGAKHVTLIEPDPAQSRQLHATAQALAIPSHKIQMIPQTAQACLPTLTEPFDIILLDPPYDLGLWQELLVMIKSHHLVHSDSLIYIESNQPLDTALVGINWLALVKYTNVGQIHAGLYKIGGNYIRKS